VGQRLPGGRHGKEGVDRAVRFPSRGLFALGVDGMDPALATAISRTSNDWLAEFCAGGSDRMFGAGMIPPHDIEGAISEARRAVTELGFTTVFVRPNPVNGRNWHDVYDDPLWAELARLGVPLSFHEGGRVHLPQPGANFDTHTCTHPLGIMLAVVDIVGGGVLERFPGLARPNANPCGTTAPSSTDSMPERPRARAWRASSLTQPGKARHNEPSVA